MELTITASTLFGEMWPIQHSPKRNLCNCGLFAPGRLLSLPPTQVGLADLRTIFCQTRASPGLVAARWRAQRAGWGDYTCSVLATAPPTPDPPTLRFGGRVSEPAIALATAGDPSPPLASLAGRGEPRRSAVAFCELALSEQAGRSIRPAEPVRLLCPVYHPCYRPRHEPGHGEPGAAIHAARRGTCARRALSRRGAADGGGGALPARAGGAAQRAGGRASARRHRAPERQAGRRHRARAARREARAAGRALSRQSGRDAAPVGPAAAGRRGGAPRHRDRSQDGGGAVQSRRRALRVEAIRGGGARAAPRPRGQRG